MHAFHSSGLFILLLLILYTKTLQFYLWLFIHGNFILWCYADIKLSLSVPLQRTGTAPLICNISTRQRWVASCMCWTFNP
jgi:hypothetical protein